MNPLGKIVNYVLPNGEIRPLMVVGSYPDTPQKLVNGVLFRDGANDDRVDGGQGQTTAWKTSVYFDPLKRPNTWHWPDGA